MKNIVLLSDGTGNSAAKLFKTNVWRIYQALDLTDETKQVAYYDDGVGTSTFKPLALLGGAMGYGLKRNVIDLYTFLCRNYKAGDRIYCFGFSRGAFTIRILVGLVSNQGLVVADNEEDLVKEARRRFSVYRDTYPSLLTHVTRRMPRKRTPDSMVRPPITFVGLWDTVAAYGLPAEELTWLVSLFLPLSVPDRNPCPIMKIGCHALALDDERRSFHPVLWNEKYQRPLIDGVEQKLTQVWFSGAHSDVGGGYAEDALSYTSLEWIMNEAAEAELAFDPSVLARIKATRNINGMLHNPRGGTGAAYRYSPRDVSSLTNDRRHNVHIETPKIHESVFRRIENSDDSYAPIVLPARYAVVDSSARPVPAPESEQAAAERLVQQKALRPLIGLRKALHFASMLVLLSLAAFPWLFKMKTVCDAGFCWPEKAVAAVLNAVLPDFLGLWLTAYAVHWEILLIHLLVLWLILNRSGLYQMRIKDRMRAIWTRKRAKPVPPDGDTVAADA